MTIKADILTHLKNRQQLAAFFGSRMSWGNAPNGTAKPYLVLHKITHDRDNALDGQSGTAHLDLQAESWGSTDLEADEGAEILRDAISGYVGPMGNTTATNVELENQFDDYETPETGTKITDYRTISLYRIGHSEAAPSL